MSNLKYMIAMIAIISQIANVSAALNFDSKKHKFRVVEMADGLYYPWGMAFLPDNLTILTEKNGSIKLLSLDTRKISIVEGGPKTSKCGQGGLMDVAAHPDYKSNYLLYFSYSNELNGVCGTEVARGKLNGLLIEGLETIFIALPKNEDHRHFGSRLLFMPDESLFISLGDRGHRPNGQDLTTHPGSLIRISANGDIPKDNPFVYIKNAAPEIYSYGHRNIQGLAVDEKRGVLWAVEHGPLGGCELNLIEGGKNYGWADITFGRNYRTGTTIGQSTERDDVEPPTYYWMPSNAPSGLAFYNHSLFPEWRGNLFVSSLTFNLISRLELKDRTIVSEERLLVNEFGRIRHVQTDPKGHIYFLTDNEKGRVLRIEPL